MVGAKKKVKAAPKAIKKERASETNATGFVEHFKHAINIILLKEESILKIAKNKEAIFYALVITIIGGILSSLKPLSTLGIIKGVIISVVAVLLLAFIIWGIAWAFKGKGTYAEFVKTMGYAEILSWLGILLLIPKVGLVISILAGIWSIVVYVMITKYVAKLDTWKAVLVVLIPLVIIAVIAILGALAFTAQNYKGLF